MVELIRDLQVERVRANRERIEGEVAEAARRAGRDPAEVEILAATKYVAFDELPVIADAGVRCIGENRAQDLVERAKAYGELFTIDFIGHLQSRKVKEVLPYARLIHSVASDSALKQLAKHADPSTEVLVEVNVAREETKSGVDPDELGSFIERCPVRVTGLMTLPPATENPDDSRRWFAALRELADQHGLTRLSMGTSQDYVVAVEEGATIVRIGTTLFR
jgi:pyridoxal phosphate enzyme (YggS family)